MAELHVLRVFVDDHGAHGNPLGVFAGDEPVADEPIPDAPIPDERCQSIAADLGFSETVFVDDAATGRLRIFTPAVELPLAGHPLVGTSWLFRHLGHPVDILRPPAGDVATWTEGATTWIRGRPEWAPPFSFVEYGSPAEIDALAGPPDGAGHVGCWSWIDEGAGEVRSRVFVPEAGIPEDEATGAAALVLVSQLARPVTIRQGRGSVLHARPGPGGTTEVGGGVVLDEVRDSRI